MESNLYPWLQSKGYLHITPQVNITKSTPILKKITDPLFIAKYAFFPLVHSIIKERKYKTGANGQRKHSHKNDKGKTVSSAKLRPLHYATHFDTLIFGYYAHLLQRKYETILSGTVLSESIIAYRKIPIPNESSNKGTIHFANEVFEHVKVRSLKSKNCVVLAFDIKSFFSNLSHSHLKSAWCDLLAEEELPDDHYNVFKATTNFSYILLDDLRKQAIKRGKRNGFDEKQLAYIRNKLGIHCFFKNVAEFRNKIKTKELKIYKHPFRNEKKEIVGIPQGLAISAVLANLYLLSFDKAIVRDLVEPLKCFYRRYSDDIVIVCDSVDAEYVEDYVRESIKKVHLSISFEKTERFTFVCNEGRTKCYKRDKAGNLTLSHFTYLGFEFDGEKKLIKSANLSKFYRRMIYSIKRKAKRAKSVVSDKAGKAVVFRRQLYRIYSQLDLDKYTVKRRRKQFIQIATGEYRLVSRKIPLKMKSNYFSYADRATSIMNAPGIKQQLRKHSRIFNEAVRRHLNK